ncbi:unnamed protein product [Acanthoscelides obtectus]|uniref:Fibronectin type-III domain-containing protein n=1 Tax=Acanthoscelides obtectus TaxID=200917 RepID=A0A9P0MBZ3_ACAOB|nr:unnamed protein product [Acanthoscelides obtectus]CAK1626936.1 hypothetical protein AOBTE_LOCUS4162 [Acanthoscelides obtectus]
MSLLATAILLFTTGFAGSMPVGGLTSNGYGNSATSESISVSASSNGHAGHARGAGNGANDNASTEQHRSGPGIPENITVTFLSPTSVRVSWATSTVTSADKYDVTYKPTDARVVAVVAGNSDAVTLSGLKADTQYQLTVAAVWAGKKYRSRPIVFRTLGKHLFKIETTSSCSAVALERRGSGQNH